MKPDLETLLEEFERLTLDSRIFLPFVSEEEVEVHVQFRQSAEGRCWSIWYPLNPGASKQTVSRHHFPMVLSAFGISERVFVTELTHILLTQAAWADEFVRDVGRVLGEDSVRQSIGNTQRFMNALQEMIREVVQEKEEAIKEPRQEESPAEVRAPESLVACGKSRLRIVRP